MKIKPKKKWGQHWLEDEEILKKIIQQLDIRPMNQVVEIGAGKGNLTYCLAQTNAPIIAIEKDRDLIKVLQKRFKRFKNVSIVCADARFFNYQFKNWILVANLPYNITSFFLRQILTLKNPPRQMVLMVQKFQKNATYASAVV